jgi:hypothetical protein
VLRPAGQRDAAGKENSDLWSFFLPLTMGPTEQSTHASHTVGNLNTGCLQSTELVFRNLLLGEVVGV